MAFTWGGLHVSLDEHSLNDDNDEQHKLYIYRLSPIVILIKI